MLTHTAYRDTYAVDLLARGASPYDVAKLLGDTVETVEKHYTPFVRELRERARRIMESGEGLEITGTQQTQQKTGGRETKLIPKTLAADEPVSRIL